MITICATISPTKNIRAMSRNIIGQENITEIFLNTPINVCEKRDVKGLYRKARVGDITNFTGVSAKYEEPTNADLTIDTSLVELEESIKMIMQLIIAKIKD
ncbi:adenylyl-sulfate kinase [Carboxylicivirga sp. N1Y90]|uniref:adenylyl-sulfate kinase n=1 Tax=Carboxylicivirga fragile TaxID=3417571 RepID=UPI003D33C9BB|nr:adenylyl-sulfate kinase [Marinilabiliaceae bacterium N1Y90]